MAGEWRYVAVAGARVCVRAHAHMSERVLARGGGGSRALTTDAARMMEVSFWVCAAANERSTSSANLTNPRYVCGTASVVCQCCLPVFYAGLRGSWHLGIDAYRDNHEAMKHVHVAT